MAPTLPKFPLRPRRLLGSALFAVFFLLFATQAAADTVLFEFTGAEQTFTVPAGVTSLHLVAVGGKGGNGVGGAASISGGLGSKASADVAVTAGEVFYVEVGGNGAGWSSSSSTSGGKGGFNGGADGASAFSYGGGGGGGASDVRTVSAAAGPTSLNSRLLIAAGGGGAGSGGAGSEGYGGEGGQPGHFGAFEGAFGGGAGTASAGGSGGTAPVCGAGAAGEDGSLGVGGAGGVCDFGGGGGGGGLFGGGGGAAGELFQTYGAGGGGGSSGFGPGTTNTAVFVAPGSGPSVEISFTAPSPPAPPGSASPPGTTISSTKISARQHKATFKFKGSGQFTGFECALLSKKAPKPKFKSCRSPKSYKRLKAGRYTFEVRAVGPGGSDPSPAKKKFKLK